MPKTMRVFLVRLLLDAYYSVGRPYLWALCLKPSDLVFDFVFSEVYGDVYSDRDQRWNLSAASSGPSDRYLGHASHIPTQAA